MKVYEKSNALRDKPGILRPLLFVYEDSVCFLGALRFLLRLRLFLWRCQSVVTFVNPRFTHYDLAELNALGDGVDALDNPPKTEKSIREGRVFELD